jgi:hypothetical protein
VFNSERFSTAKDYKKTLATFFTQKLTPMTPGGTRCAQAVPGAFDWSLQCRMYFDVMTSPSDIRCCGLICNNLNRKWATANISYSTNTF